MQPTSQLTLGFSLLDVAIISAALASTAAYLQSGESPATLKDLSDRDKQELLQDLRALSERFEKVLLAIEASLFSQAFNPSSTPTH